MLSANSPIQFLQKNLESKGSGQAQRHSQDARAYKPKYKNLKDAYEEFKALKKEGGGTAAYSNRSRERQLRSNGSKVDRMGLRGRYLNIDDYEEGQELGNSGEVSLVSDSYTYARH